MILASRRNRNYPTNIHAPATQCISIDLQLDRGTVLDRQMNMSYWVANRSHLVDANFNNVNALRGEVSVEKGFASFTIMSPSHRIVGRFFIKLHIFIYIIKVFNLTYIYIYVCVCVCVCVCIMNLLIFNFSLGHSRDMEDDPFVRSTRYR